MEALSSLAAESRKRKRNVTVLAVFGALILIAFVISMNTLLHQA